ncbi:uncharacterized protein EI97DRAFT_499215 [Westerdykella ornata]|uniref:Protein kinase domain-containing protein n=1 Tax=Westerdykella ornata TaxID=318751 RepID=A0A6A6JS93_WESOR|nr:uncharacterized protein EI97DRAFT_499215 [Westerdykella ornata]KAF2278596.1 hypothetical protein EI97DRAFT_499215 [Westerdykella ornata]
MPNAWNHFLHSVKAALRANGPSQHWSNDQIVQTASWLWHHPGVDRTPFENAAAAGASNQRLQLNFDLPTRAATKKEANAAKKARALGQNIDALPGFHIIPAPPAGAPPQSAQPPPPPPPRPAPVAPAAPTAPTAPAAPTAPTAPAAPATAAAPNAQAEVYPWSFFPARPWRETLGPSDYMERMCVNPRYDKTNERPGELLGNESDPTDERWEMTRDRTFLHSGTQRGDGVRRWHGAKMLGKGGYGRAGLWVRTNGSGNILERMVIKECIWSGDQWHSAKNWLDRLPREVRLHQLIEAGRRATGNAPEYRHVVEVFGHRLMMHHQRYRLYMQYAPHGDLHDALRKIVRPYSRKDPLGRKDREYDDESYTPMEFIWYFFSQLVDACLVLQQGSVGGRLDGWKGITHCDLGNWNNVLLAEPLEGEITNYSEYSEDSEGSEDSEDSEENEKSNNSEENVDGEQSKATWPTFLIADLGFSFHELSPNNTANPQNNDKGKRSQKDNANPDGNANPNIWQNNNVPDPEHNDNPFLWKLWSPTLGGGRYPPEMQWKSTTRIDEKSDVWQIASLVHMLIVHHFPRREHAGDLGPLTEDTREWTYVKRTGAGDNAIRVETKELRIFACKHTHAEDHILVKRKKGEPDFDLVKYVYPPELRQLVARCLSYDKDKRPTLAELRDLIEPHRRNADRPEVPHLIMKRDRRFRIGRKYRPPMGM